jgi:hypothetical protein
VFSIKEAFLDCLRIPVCDSCNCGCDSCKTAKLQQVNDDVDYAEFILKDLAEGKPFCVTSHSDEALRRFRETYETKTTSCEQSDLESIRLRMHRAAQTLVRLNICKWSSDKSSLLPGSLCRGTVLEFRLAGYDIDAVSAAKFATGVNEDEVIVPSGSQFVLKSSQVEEMRGGNGGITHVITRMTLKHLVNINSDGPTDIASLQGMIQMRSAHLFCNKRAMLPGSRCYTWADVEECATDVYAPDAARTWRSKQCITFGSTLDDRRPAQRPHHDGYKQFLSACGRLAYLFDERQFLKKPALKKWGGYLISQAGTQVYTFHHLARDANNKKEDFQNMCRDLDVRYLAAVAEAKARAATGKIDPHFLCFDVLFDRYMSDHVNPWIAVAQRIHPLIANQAELARLAFLQLRELIAKSLQHRPPPAEARPRCTPPPLLSQQTPTAHPLSQVPLCKPGSCSADRKAAPVAGP